MKMSKMAMALAVAGLLACGQAFAADRTGSYYAPATQNNQVAYEYGNYYAADEDPAAEEPAAEATATDACVGCADGCDAGCGDGCDAGCGDGCDAGCGDGCDSGCGSSCCDCGPIWPCGCALADLGDPCKLWEPCCAESPWSMNGWLDQSFVWNPYNPDDKFNGPMTWTDRANEYQMQEFWLGGGRTTNTDGAGIDIGGRIDAFYGTNYRWDTAAGLETPFGINGQFYGMAIPNAYGEVAINNTKIKIGHFTSPVGFFAVGSPNNFFAVLPYTFQYGEPFTHTGFLATNQISDKLAVGGGMTHGWDVFDNSGNPNAGGLWTVTLTPNDKDAFYYVGLVGNEPNFTGTNFNAQTGLGFTTRYLQTLVWTHQVSDNVQAVLQSDFGTQSDAVVAGKDARWYGLNGYLFWNQTNRFQWGMNGEWFRDQGGFRVGGVLPSFGSPNARGLSLGRSGYDGSFYRFMIGPRYFFNPNMYARVSLACDWYDGKVNNAGGLKPFDDGTKNHQQVMVFDFVTTF